MKDTYIYPAIFYYEDDGISIEFPDLNGCLPCADTIEEAIKNSKEAMALHLYGMEQDGEEIPTPTNVKNIKIDNNGVIILVEVYMPTFREKMANKVIKKTLTIPSWLNVEAERCGINFSQTLQEALKQKLNVN